MNPGGRLPKPIALFVLILLACAGGSWIDAAWGYLHIGKPGLVYLWMSYPGFDFVDYTLQFPYLHTARFFTLPVFPWVYPAPAVFVLYPFYKLVAVTNRLAGVAVFSLTVVVSDGLLAWRFRKALTRHGLSPAAASGLLGATVLAGWPIYFSLQRGNIESLLWIGTAVGVFCFAKRRYLEAATLFGIVGAIKLYPLLFLALLLKPRRFPGDRCRDRRRSCIYAGWSALPQSRHALCLEHDSHRRAALDGYHDIFLSLDRHRH